MISQDSIDSGSFRIQDLLSLSEGHARFDQSSQPSARYLTYVPIFYNDGQPIEAGKLDQVIHRVVAFCGGATVSLERVGAWFDPDAGLECWETVVVIDAMTTVAGAERFFGDLKTETEVLLQQSEVFIVCQTVAKIEAPALLPQLSNGSDLVVTQLLE